MANRPFGGASYWWMSSRSKNASRRFAVMGIVGGLVFIAALIAFVLVPRQATRAAVSVTARLEERPDSGQSVAIRDRAAAEIAAADSMLSVARRTIAPPQVAVVDTFPPEAKAQRQALSDEIASLGRLIDRADNAPLPSSYRALAASPSLASEAQVTSLVDSLSDIEKERDAFGTVSGVDPVYVALTSRATAIGRQIQAIAETKRSELRSQLAVLKPPAPVVVASTTHVDTTKFLAEKTASQQAYAGAVQSLAQIRATDARIDSESSQARDLANLGAPPLAMLAAALVLALTIGFAASFIYELRRPTVADSREAEQVTGVRVLSVIQPAAVVAERSRRQADVSGPPLIDVVSESYRRLYLHLAATEANIPIVTVVGDDAAIVATVASNIAAAAAYEARSTLLVDVDPATSAIANVFRIRSNPGLSDIVTERADWADAVTQAIIGRDRMLDILPSGTRRGLDASPDAVQRIRGDFARMERRYDLIVIAAPTAYVLRSAASVIPGPDIVLCARVSHTRIAKLRATVEQLRAMDLRIHGLVLWNDDLPVIETQEQTEPEIRNKTGARDLVGAR
jgi:Mrp family chromosome partitioning ATPase